MEEDSEIIHTVRLESCHDSTGSIFNGLRWVELRGEGGGTRDREEGERGGKARLGLCGDCVCGSDDMVVGVGVCGLLTTKSEQELRENRDGNKRERALVREETGG